MILTAFTRDRRPRALRRAVVLVASSSCLVLAACGGSAGTASDGEGWAPEGDIEWIVPYSPGGGFDTYSRGIAQVMQEGHLPDGVNVAVRNVTPLPRGITQMYTAEPDGQTVGILPMPAAIAQQIQDPDLAHWETDQFTVLGSVDENAYVIYVPADSPYQTIEDLQAAEDLNAITVERGSSSALAGLAAIEELGLDAEVTYGAEGSAEVVAAALRGDADFFVYGSTDLVGFVESGDIRPLLFLGTEDQRPEEFDWLADVPNAEDAGAPDLTGTVTELRVIVAPPDLPDDVASYLRTTLEETMADDAFLQWAEEAERPIIPRDHEEAAEAVDAQIERMQDLVPRLTE